MALTEFYCIPGLSGASNLNAGSTTAGAAAFTYASGSWVAGTGVFTVASGNPSSDGVAVGDFASVYPNGSTEAVFIGRVTARDTTTITVSLTAKSGTAPTDGTGTRTLKIGGTWTGPSGAVTFPFSIMAGALTNATGNAARVNLKNTATYSITTGLAVSSRYMVQGYTTTPGDKGKAVIDCGTSAIVGLTLSGSRSIAKDLEVIGAATTGTSAGVALTADAMCVRILSHGHRGAGITFSDTAVLDECEVYGCNTANTANIGGITQTGVEAGFLSYCYSHDNAGTNASGLVMSASADVRLFITHSIFDTNGRHGILARTRVGTMVVMNSDLYNNVQDGIRVTTSTNGGNVFVKNCNFLNNGTGGTGWGYNNDDTVVDYIDYLLNNGFGSGTEENASGTVSGVNVTSVDAVTYAADTLPWTDGPGGNFAVSLTAAKGAGRGVIPPNMTGYTDLGAVQHADAGSAGMLVHPGMGGGMRG